MLLIAAGALVSVGTLNLSQRLTKSGPATDGVYWVEEAGGLKAKSIVPASAAARSGIVEGDRLIAVSEDGENYQEVVSSSDVQIWIDQAGITGTLHYLIERPSYPQETRFYYADLYNLGSIPNWTTRDIIINLVGVVYLLVGLFVIFKQGGGSPFVLHFASLCISAFVFHFYRPTGAYEDLDIAVAFLNDVTFLIFAPVFLHFCIIYPVNRHPSDTQRRVMAAIYLPATALILLSTLIYFIPDAVVRLPDHIISLIYKIEFIHFLLSLVAGSSLLLYRFLSTKSAVVRQQLKWVVWGTLIAIIPFTLIYSIQYLFDLDLREGAQAVLITRLTDLSLLPLALIPLAFGNSVVRYRLMDVDLVVRRSAVYAMTTLSVALMIGIVVYTAGIIAIGGQTITPGILSLRMLIAVIAMAVIAMTASPLKSFLQERMDRLFYGERYDLRNGLVDFGRTISATTALEPLLDSLVVRLREVLGVERIAIFIEDTRLESQYRVARAVGLSNEIQLTPEFHQEFKLLSSRTGIVRGYDLEQVPENSSVILRRELHYYVPCVVRGRMVAIIGLGRAADGSLLSSEDLEILKTISGYIAVAIENSLLYQEQKERASELALLKEFNESIIESVNVSLVAVDLEGRIIRCNHAFEKLLETGRENILTRSIEEFFSKEFSSSLRQVLGDQGWKISDARRLYKIHTSTDRGRSLVLNLACAPLHTDSKGQKGGLIVLEDVTHRTHMEEQLQQHEKLSSIGMLAAGVAHEINTPLTGVSSYTQMLLGMIPESDPKHTLLQKVSRQTTRASDIVNNLLNFSRTGEGADHGEVDLIRVLDDTIQLLEPQLRGRYIEILKEYHSTFLPVLGNPGKLQQIFTNLILNARDAITGSGTITIKAWNDEQNIFVEVADTGSGIAAENLNKIYDPFYSTKEIGKGTGLGLAVTYGIVQEHSATISVDSLEGKGTTFKLTFPAYYSVARLRSAGD
jgi:two-component system, NtrC family, sensor kinase